MTQSGRRLARKSHRGTTWLEAIAASLLIAALAQAADDPPAVNPPAGKQAAPAKKAAHPANRLAKETSPYLLLHAHNPVDWYPWGEEALAKAKADNKPIFLSVGYSSCYWCHVMERESFLDEEIAAFLNKHFVCIKVDREERPDIDEIYMAAVQLMNRRGGWPMTVFMTADGKPFFGGTYFPARDKEVELPAGTVLPPGQEKPRQTGFFTLVKLVQEAWLNKNKEVLASSEQISNGVRLSLSRRGQAGAEKLDPNFLDMVQADLAQQYDKVHGGFGFSETNDRRPKFPEPSNFLFLLDRVRRDKNAQAAEMLNATLLKMAAGGIRDHLGGGFHRYSTDRYWRIPHFEKMLYDNGQLASVYAQAYQLTDSADPAHGEFRRVAEELLTFVSREMTDPAGGFYAALDAETNAEEGQYYVWQKTKLQKLLTPAEFELLSDVYGLNGEPNFEERWTLVLRSPWMEIAAGRKLSGEQLAKQLTPIHEKLLAARSKRPRPLTDTKILTSWNGLMIRGFADAGRLLEKPDYIQTAVKSAEFVLKNLRTADGRLLRTYGGGQAKLNAYLDDYAFFVDGLLALHQATGDRRWLTIADELATKQLELFWDDEAKGCFYTSKDHEALLARTKDPVDGAIPSGNAVSAGNLIYLGQALKKADYLDKAEQTVHLFAAFMNQNPAAMPRMAVSLAALQEARKGMPAAGK
jgi:uncharacterized protein YyaL (SSP411 family)